MVKNMFKDALLISAGVFGAVAYQKYSKTVFDKMEKVVDRAVKKVDESLEEMM